MTMLTMKKLLAITPAGQKSRLLKKFSHLGCLEIKTAQGALEYRKSGLLQEVKAAPIALDEQKELAQALQTLQRYAPQKKPFLSPKPRVTESQLYDAAARRKGFETAGQINALNHKLQALHNQQNQLEAKITALRPWAASNAPLEIAGGKHYRVMRLASSGAYASSDVLAQWAEIPLTAVELVAETADEQYYLVVCHISAEEQALELVRQLGNSRIQFKEEQGPASAHLAQNQAALEALQAQEAELTAELAGLNKLRPLLEQVLDAQTLEAQRENISTAMLATHNTIYFEAWLPAGQEEAVAALLEEHGCAYQIVEAAEGDDPPVLLENSKYIRPFSAITELYGLPAYGSVIDPNPFVAVFFFIFFGMMLGDAMYGLLLAAGCAYVLKKALPVGTLQKFMQVAMAVGISSILFGALFSSWFGDFPVALGNMLGFNWNIPPILFSPLDNPILMLGIALGIGVVHLFIGMGLAGWRMIRQGQVFDAICDIGFWYLIIIGLVAAVAGYLIGVESLISGIYIAAAGAVGVILTGGRKKKNIFGKILGGFSSLYNVTSYLSDILSYSRLMALGLSTGVVAQVLNTMGSLAGNGILGWVLFILVFLVGQVFNLAIGLLGAFVHSCRLIYVEFFGKFFEGGGRAFVPLTNKTKYTQVIKEEN